MPKIKLSPRSQRYISWMKRLNEINGNRIEVRSKFTWRAFCSGKSPEDYLIGLGRFVAIR